MDKITIERETLQQLHDEMETVEYDADPPKRVLALMEKLRAALAAQPAEPVAWRLRIGDSDVWSFTETERDADFFGNQSGLRYVKEPLYAAQSADYAIGYADGFRDACKPARMIYI